MRRHSRETGEMRRQRGKKDEHTDVACLDAMLMFHVSMHGMETWSWWGFVG